ncbi:MAG: hypothetical protein R3C16_07125 [Hyphomonadaceae bacterium]
MRVSFAVLALAVVAAACTPPAQRPEDAPGAQAGADDEQNDPLARALTPVVAADLGRPIKFTVETSRTDGEWGWIVAHPWTPEGAAIDWSQTNYAQRAGAGMLDGGGTTFALMRQENGAWRVVEFVVGPTDAAWVEWPQRHGAPQSLVVEAE